MGRRASTPNPCSISGCNRATVARGWCHTHYMRWKRTGNPLGTLPGRTYPARNPCSVDGCDALSASRGMCNPHYQGVITHGHPLGKLYADHGEHIAFMRSAVVQAYPNRPILPVPIRVGERSVQIKEKDLDRFLAKVQMGPDSTWVWHGDLNHQGYGTFSVQGVDIRAHRFAYVALIGPIADGLHLDHALHNLAVAAGQCSGGICACRRVVSPRHLTPTTLRGNLMGGTGKSAWALKTDTCKQGHPLSGGNLRLQPTKNGRTRRVCRTCQRLGQAKYRQRKAAAQATIEP